MLISHHYSWVPNAEQQASSLLFCVQPVFCIQIESEIRVADVSTGFVLGFLNHTEYQLEARNI